MTKLESMIGYLIIRGITYVLVNDVN